MAKVLNTLLVVSDSKDLPENSPVGQIALVRNANNVYFKGEFGWFRMTKEVITKNPAEKKLHHEWNEIEQYLKTNILIESDVCTDYQVKKNDESVLNYINAVHQTDAKKPNVLRLLDACSIEERNYIQKQVDTELFKQIKEMLNSEEDIQTIDKLKEKYVDNLINKGRDKDLKIFNEIRNDINRSRKLVKTLRKVKTTRQDYDGRVSLLDIEPKTFVNMFNNIDNSKKKKKHWYKNKKKYATTNKKGSKENG